jgi:hypothetical protein
VDKTWGEKMSHVDLNARHALTYQHLPYLFSGKATHDSEDEDSQ